MGCFARARKEKHAPDETPADERRPFDTPMRARSPGRALVQSSQRLGVATTCPSAVSA